MPHRRGQGLSASSGIYIREQIPAASTMVRLLETDHLSDQLAALAWLRKRSDVSLNRIAVAGNSFGGIEALLGVERTSYCAAVDVSGGAESWASAPAVRDLMLRAALWVEDALRFLGGHCATSAP